MKVVLTIGGLGSRFGGPSRTVPALCRALAARGVEIELITLSDVDKPESSERGEAFQITFVRRPAKTFPPLAWRREFCAAVSHALVNSRPVVLYDVGMWLPSNHMVRRIALRASIPRIVSPRGMLSPRALRVSRWKKAMAWRLYQKRDLASAQMLHVTSETETQDCRRCGLRNPIAMVPNGVEIPNQLPVREDAPGAVRTLLFLSRLHPIKGLADLVEAWARVRPAGWRVVIAGPDEGNHRRDLEAQIAALNMRQDFEFVGPALDEAKWNLFASADLFVLPSHSESFGQAVAEALACGVPVITTRATPWQELEAQVCGWWIPTGADALAETLGTATSRSERELRAMGERGRALVISNYSWAVAAEKLMAAFEWLVDRREMPNCVRQER